MYAMRRFIQSHHDNGLSPHYYDYREYRVLPLLSALERVESNISHLDHGITYFKHYGNHSSTFGLTQDESAAIFIYAYEYSESPLHSQLNLALRSENSSMLAPWFLYLKLLNTALQKLPTINGEVWRGMSIDIANRLAENEEIIWGCVSSCSLSKDIINRYINQNTVLCSIKVLNGKDICNYTLFRSDCEVLLLPGTRLLVKRISFDAYTRKRVIHLVELPDKNDTRPVSIHNSISARNKPPASPSDIDRSQKDKEYSITTFSNGDIYEVTYKNGEKLGYGTFYPKNGYAYKGYDASTRANGTGSRIRSNGDRCDGNFTDGKMTGYGSLSRADGYTYVGHWTCDKPNGNGNSTWANGNHYEGSHEYGKIHGKGKFSSANGDTYEGDLVDGKAHGQGVRIWTDGDQYKGEFIDDKKHGRGTYNYGNGGKYNGDWANDKMNGYGVLQWPSKTVYEGSFKNGKRHGVGKLIFANGKVQNALQSRNKETLKPWRGFFRLLYAAFTKLPTVNQTIWRGLLIDVAAKLEENQELVLCCITSCSLSADIMVHFFSENSVLCSIKPPHSKDLQFYAFKTADKEVVLLPGTHLRVKSKKSKNKKNEPKIIFEEISQVIYDEEIDHDSKEGLDKNQYSNLQNLGEYFT
ncbi:unnamed protein product [Rotaria socialis]|uniref:NAD(+)--protein-arginine ADP-ribosyltransferase n=1 Tax=Rotaria socialis TaxID=392032 RepID=A0A818KAN3_9BILA|nr:unnamed protein product [Rotaria socialis]